MTLYDSLILDHDGVIANVLDEQHRTAAFQERFEQSVEPDDVDRFDRETITLLANTVAYDEIRALGARLDVDPERLWTYRDETMADVLTEAVLDGRKQLYDDATVIAELDLPVGVASNNQRHLVEFMLDRYGVSEHIETVHARDPKLSSLQIKKPEPTLLKAAIADLNVERPLYVGDKETDVIAGQRAGVDTAFLRRDHNSGRSLSREPTYELSGLDEVGALLDGASEQ